MIDYNDVISNVHVYGLKESIVASGYPMRTEPKIQLYSDTNDIYSYDYYSGEYYDPDNIMPDEKEQFESEVERGSKHFKRMKHLAKTPIGSGHSTALVGIVVQFDLRFTVKAWTEAERYHFLDFVSLT